MSFEYVRAVGNKEQCKLDVDNLEMKKASSNTKHTLKNRCSFYKYIIYKTFIHRLWQVRSAIYFLCT